MGSLIVQEVVKDLLSKGLETARVLLLAGSRFVGAIGPSKVNVCLNVAHP